MGSDRAISLIELRSFAAVASQDARGYCCGSPLETVGDLRLGMDQDKSSISNRLGGLEKKLLDLESSIKTLQNHQHRLGPDAFQQLRRATTAASLSKSGAAYSDSEKEEEVSTFGFNHLLAESITGLIGFRELLTYENRYLRFVWFCLFSIGVGATGFYIVQIVSAFLQNPTVTSMKLIANKSYEYPPLLLCPDGWLDAGKADRHNMSTDALVYSLAYIDFFDRFKLSNTTAARLEFLDAFERQNISSLSDYYKSIAVELEEVRTVEAIVSNERSSYLCKGCDPSKPVELVCMNGGMCYAIWLKPDTVGSALGLSISSNSRNIVITLADMTRGLMHVSEDWELYFSSDLSLQTSVSPYLIITAAYYSMVKLHAQKFFMINRPEAPCIDERDMADRPNYLTESCMAECKNRLYKEAIRCYLLPLSTGNSQHPLDYCNALDKVCGGSSLTSFIQSSESEAIENEFDRSCVAQCPYKCERVLFQITLQAITSMDDYDPENLTSVKERNMSLVYIDVVHSGSLQGGTSTLNEVYLYSFEDIVSSIGGTLGLFLGATLLTFFQLISFLVNYLIGRMS